MILLASVAVVACSTVDEGPFDWQTGWREATVLEVGPASQIAAGQSSDCRLWMTPQQLSSGRFALLSYVDFGRPRHRVTPLKEGEVVRPGDDVYVNLSACDIALQPRPQHGP